MIAVLIVVSPFLLFSAPVYSQPSWPTSWIQVDWDKNENGPVDDWRDVEYAYYQFDSNYLYFKLECYDLPGKEWAAAPDGDGRYKWFIDLEGNLYHSGENIYDAEYLLFVEDTDEDANGEMYLLYDTNGDNNFGEYEPWPPVNYAIYEITDPNVGDWRIDAPYQIEMYISWASIGAPSSYWVTWATDQENPNLDQGPTTDHVDEEQPIQGIVKYYLTVTSSYDTPGGEGWYANCTDAYATLDNGIVDYGNGTRRVFTHWSGDASGTNYTQSDPIHMDQNKTAIANWKTQYQVTFDQTGLDNTATGTVVTVDGVGKSFGDLPFTEWFDSGSSVNYAYTSIAPSSDSGKRFVLVSVTGPTLPFTVTGPVTVTGNYKTQYQLTVRTNGLGTSITNVYNGATVLGTANDATPYTNWFDEGSSLQLNIDSPITVGSTRFVFTQWSGDATGTSRPLPLTVNSAKDITANYKTQYKVTFDQSGVGTDFAGPVVTIDGTGYTVTNLPVSFWWDESSIHNFIFQSPLVVTLDAKQYVWTSTSGLSSEQSGTITISTSGSIIGNYKTQYYLTVTSPYDSPTPTSGWFDSGTSITASVTSPWPPGATNTRYVCTGWTGTGSVPASGTTKSVTFTINAPSSITWNWKTQFLLVVRTDPTGLSPQPTRSPAGETGPGGWWYDSPTSVQLTAQPVTNFDFLNWDVDTTPVSGNPITVPMDGPHVVTAHYQTVAPPPAVGGHALPINLDLGASDSLIPQIGLASALSATVTATIILVRRRKKTLRRKH